MLFKRTLPEKRGIEMNKYLRNFMQRWYFYTGQFYKMQILVTEEYSEREDVKQLHKLLEELSIKEELKWQPLLKQRIALLQRLPLQP